jgi:DNA repair exonuclease SbcCD nuclease subunit
MRIIHFSDTHLGYRAYNRVHHGVNQRERDMLETFRRALSSMLEYDADVIVHAGDFFDRVRPSNYTLRETLDIMRAFQELRSNRPFLVVAGNHECPRTADTVSPLALLRDIPGVVIADRGIVQYNYNGYHFTLVPDNPFLPDTLRVAVEPDPYARGSILVVHGALQAYSPNAVRKLPEQMLDTDRWNYIALGDYHIATEVKPRCWYSGALDYCSSDIWSESHGAAKRFLVIDTDNGYDVQSHLIQPSRVVYDSVIVASAYSCLDCLHGAIERELTRVERDWIVRIVIENVPDEWYQSVLSPAVQELRNELFYCQVLVKRRGIPTVSLGTKKIDLPDLMEAWDQFADEYFRDNPEREALKRLGRHYLEKCDEEV